MPPLGPGANLIHPAGPALEQGRRLVHGNELRRIADRLQDLDHLTGLRRSTKSLRRPCPADQIQHVAEAFRSGGNGTSNSVRHRSNPSSVRSSKLLSLTAFSRWRTLRLIRSDRVSTYTSCSSTTLTAGSRDQRSNQAASRVGSSRAIHRNSQASSASIIGASSPALPRSPSRWPSPSSRWGRQRTSPETANTKRRARSCDRAAVMRYSRGGVPAQISAMAPALEGTAPPNPTDVLGQRRRDANSRTLPIRCRLQTRPRRGVPRECRHSLDGTLHKLVKCTA